MDDAIELDPRRMKLKLPNHRDRHWKDAIKDLLNAANTECVDLDCGDWLLTYTDLQDLMVQVDQSGRRLDSLISNVPATVVSAKAFGIEARLQQSESFGSRELISQELPSESTPTQPTGVMFHQGTLRSGDYLQSDRSILIYGDVNPGATVSSSGDIFIWGRLRGVAHAGADGSTQARIIALQLRPLQLRIADAVARGPDDLPQPGLAEQASLREGVIRIDPAEVLSFQHG
jgi:septum site-determining protein MinC